MTAPIAPQRLAELRERYDSGVDDALEALLELMATGRDGWLTKGRANWTESLREYQADHVALLAEVERLRARVEELTDRVITAETNNADAEDLKRENTELRRALADTPTTEAAVAKLREWCPDHDPGATHIMMTVAMARKLLAAIDDDATRRKSAR